MNESQTKSVFALECGGVRYPLCEGEHLVGRSAECSIQLPQVTVSRRHLMIQVSGEGVVIVDLGSHNGTWLNRRRLRPGEAAKVSFSDQIYLPAVALRICPMERISTANSLAVTGSGDVLTPTSSGSYAACLPAGSIVRLGATLVDMLLFTLLSGVIAVPLLLRLPISVQHVLSLDGLTALAGDGSWLRLALACLILWVAVWWAYFVVGWGLLGATPGQWLFGLRVVDHRGRYPIGPARAALRLVAYSISSLPLCGGHLLVLFRGDCRALHDVLAGTRVISRRLRASAAPEPAAQTAASADITVVEGHLEAR
ncbi:MAG: RDD family protein [Acidobacteria bacterium]|nr:RDD family protein [Acidobacteriota bacterium]